MDVVANKMVEKVLGTTSLDAIQVLDLRSDRLKPLGDAAPNTKHACIWGRIPRTSSDFALCSNADPGWKEQE